MRGKARKLARSPDLEKKELIAPRRNSVSFIKLPLLLQNIVFSVREPLSHL
uniref:Uncharacterized protein n=1 Tax=Picea glauca TaxID=3330 RepID=A0A117NHD9_PICGL|nr:hypothetical protein ABT39_MTgene5215 [Picea glauca]QHR91189.1 hypothetical protein Q903MT_gene5221 [Picea sitchensis]